MKRVLFVLVALLVMGVLPRCTFAASSATPPGWPWRGINTDSVSSTPADIAVVASRLGINSVHLQLWPETLGERNHLTADQAWSRALAWVDAMLEACKKRRIVGIVEVTGIPLAKLQVNSQFTPQFWHSEVQQRAYLSRLSSLAQNLRHFGPEFAAYDIMSEPVVMRSGRGEGPTSWPNLQREIVQALRTQDPGRWIMVKPGPFGSPRGYKGFKALNFPRLIYSVHMYDPHKFTHQGIKQYRLGPTYPGRVGFTMWDKSALEHDLSSVIEFQRAHDVPIYVGEFSAVRWAPGARQYLEDLVSIFNTHDWGWAYFAFSGWNGWNPDYNDVYPSGPRSLKSELVGVKSKRWATLRAILPKTSGTN